MLLNQLQLGSSVRILLRTMPILLMRLGIYLAFWVLLLFYLGIVFGAGFLLSRLWEPLGVIVGILALVTTIPIYQLAYRYVFFLLKAAHLAIIVEFLQNGGLPDGTSQVAWGKEQVMSRFGQVSVMFVVDELVTAIITLFTNTTMALASMLPGETIRTLMRIINRVIRYAIGYVDEAILARAFWRRDENIWHSAQEGVVLYAMVWKAMVINAVVLMLLSYVPFFLAVLVFSTPIAYLLSLISTTLAAFSIVLVLLFGFLVKVALGDSFAMTVMVAAYYHATEGLSPDPAMEVQLATMSDKFRDLRSRAAGAVGGTSGGYEMTPGATRPGAMDIAA
jgi:hypothetical protein